MTNGQPRILSTASTGVARWGRDSRTWSDTGALHVVGPCREATADRPGASRTVDPEPPAGCAARPRSCPPTRSRAVGKPVRTQVDVPLLRTRTVAYCSCCAPEPGRALRPNASGAHGGPVVPEVVDAVDAVAVDAVAVAVALDVVLLGLLNDGAVLLGAVFLGVMCDGALLVGAVLVCVEVPAVAAGAVAVVLVAVASVAARAVAVEPDAVQPVSARHPPSTISAAARPGAPVRLRGVRALPPAPLIGPGSSPTVGAGVIS